MNFILGAADTLYAAMSCFVVVFSKPYKELLRSLLSVQKKIHNKAAPFSLQSLPRSNRDEKVTIVQIQLTTY